MKAHKPRVVINWNTGSRTHKPKKGKGSYRRTPKHRGWFFIDSQLILLLNIAYEHSRYERSDSHR